MEQETLSDYYPTWLHQCFVGEEDLPWEKAKTMSFQQFAEKYTLHDSYWVGVFCNVAYENSALFVIRWDAVWLPDEVAESTMMVAQWPLLFIKVEGMYQLSTSGYEDIGIQRGIAGAEIVEVDNKQLLVIDDHYGGSVEIVFDGNLKFLALCREKEVLDI